jgi:uncharacterized delta-60 repeat protein
VDTPTPRRHPLSLERLEDRSTPTLTLDVTPGGFAESAGAAAATGTVTRTGATTDPLTVHLTSSDPSEATVPATVVIPAGQAFATFPITAVNDPALDGHQPVRITAAVHAPGTTWTGPDAAFGTSGFRMVSVQRGDNSSLPDVAVLPDGRIAAAGASFWYGGTWALTRVTADGTTTYNDTTNTTFPSSVGGYANAVAAQPDGKVLVAGTVLSGASTLYDEDDWGVARYLANGNLDTTFGTSGYFRKEFDSTSGFRGAAHDLAVLPDGKILVAGNRNSSTIGFTLARLTADGQPDATFGTGGFIGVGADPAAAALETGLAMAVQPDGKIVLVGALGYNPPHAIGVVRLNPDGTPDTTFSGDGRLVLPAALFGSYTALTVAEVALQPDGKIVLAGTAGTNEDADMAAARLNADGTLDATFSEDGVATIDYFGLDDGANDVAVAADGSIVLAGRAALANTDYAIALVRLTPGGVPDLSFDQDGRYVAPPQPSIFEEVWSVELLPDGRLIALGGYQNDARVVRFHLGRELEADAEAVEVQDDEVPPPNPTLTLTLDRTTFRETAGAGAATATLTRTGDLSFPLTVVMSTSDSSEARWAPSVVIPAGQASVAVPIDAIDDQILDGSQPVTLTARTDFPTAYGPMTRDADFGSLFNTAPVGGIAFAPDGKLLTAHTYRNPSTGAEDFVLIRYSADGIADTTFGPSGSGRVQLDVLGSADRVAAVAVQPDGKIVVGGTGAQNPNERVILVRYNADGSLDTTFGTGGKVTAPLPVGNYSRLSDLVILPDGKILIAGGVYFSGAGFDFLAARYNPDGTLDATFGTGGVATVPAGTGSDFANGMAVQPDGKIVLVGVANGWGTASSWAVARLLPNGSLDTGFGTNGVVLTNIPGNYDEAWDVAVQPDGKLVVTAAVNQGEYLPLTEAQLVLARYNPDGTPDATFGAGGVAIPGVVSSNRYSPLPVGLQPDGRIVVGATFGTAAESRLAGVYRFGPDGTLHEWTLVQNDNSSPVELLVRPDGQIYFAYESHGWSFVERYRSPASTTLTTVVVVEDHEPYWSVNDAYETDEDVPLVVPAPGVRANDTVEAGAPGAAAVVVTGPRDGTLTLNADGSFTYTPRAGFFGADAFTYRLTSGGSLVGNTVTVALTVRPLNDAPVARDVAYTATEDTPLVTTAAPTGAADLLLRYTFDEATSGNAPAQDSGLFPPNTGTPQPGAGRVTDTPGGRSPAAMSVASSFAAAHLTTPDADEIDSATALTLTFWLNLRSSTARSSYLFLDSYTGNTPPGGDFPGMKLWHLRLANESGGHIAQSSAFGLGFQVYERAPDGSLLDDYVFSPATYNAFTTWAFAAVTVTPQGAAQSQVTFFQGTPGGAAAVVGTRTLDAVLGGPNLAPLTVGYGVPGWLDDVRVYDRALTAEEIDAVRREGGGAGAPLSGVLFTASDQDLDLLTAEVVTGPANGALTLNPDGSFVYTPNPNFNGTDSFTYRAFDGTVYSAPATVTLTVAPVPDVFGVAVNGGAAQRSRVTELTVTFDEVVDPALLATAFALTRPADGAAVGAIAVATQVVDGRTVATLTFSGANVESGSLADGRWTLAVDRTKVRSLAGAEMAADFTASLHRLFGDSEGDADVDVLDLARFRQAYGKSTGQPGYAAHFDFEGDGDVDVLDLSRFRQRYGRTLP